MPPDPTPPPNPGCLFSSSPVCFFLTEGRTPHETGSFAIGTLLFFLFLLQVVLGGRGGGGLNWSKDTREGGREGHSPSAQDQYPN